MTSSTTFARGAEWSAATLYDGWGDNIFESQIEALGNLVVIRFEELCAGAGDPSIWWSPRTSEVIGSVYGETTDEHHWSDSTHDVDLDLDAFREQAREEVWEAVCGYDTSMSARVREVFNEPLTVTEAARRYDVPRASITWAIRQGYLPAEKDGRNWVIMSINFEDWQENRPGRGRKASQ